MASFVDAHYHSYVRALGRSGNNDLFGPSVDVGASLAGLGKKSRRLQHYLDL